MLFSQVVQHMFTQQQVSLSVPFPLSTRLRYVSLCPHQVSMLNELAKRLEQKVSLVAHPVGRSYNLDKAQLRRLGGSGAAVVNGYSYHRLQVGIR